ncbi:unnamed protein product [Chrysoparadoxa australica]
MGSVSFEPGIGTATLLSREGMGLVNDMEESDSMQALPAQSKTVGEAPAANFHSGGGGSAFATHPGPSRPSKPATGTLGTSLMHSHDDLEDEDGSLMSESSQGLPQPPVMPTGGLPPLARAGAPPLSQHQSRQLEHERTCAADHMRRLNMCLAGHLPFDDLLLLHINGHSNQPKEGKKGTMEGATNLELELQQAKAHAAAAADLRVETDSLKAELAALKSEAEVNGRLRAEQEGLSSKVAAAHNAEVEGLRAAARSAEACAESLRADAEGFKTSLAKAQEEGGKWQQEAGKLKSELEAVAQAKKLADEMAEKLKSELEVARVDDPAALEVRKKAQAIAVAAADTHTQGSASEVSRLRSELAKLKQFNLSEALKLQERSIASLRSELLAVLEDLAAERKAAAAMVQGVAGSVKLNSVSFGGGDWEGGLKVQQDGLLEGGQPSLAVYLSTLAKEMRAARYETEEWKRKEMARAQRWCELRDEKAALTRRLGRERAACDKTCRVWRDMVADRDMQLARLQAAVGALAEGEGQGSDKRKKAAQLLVKELEECTSHHRQEMERVVTEISKVARQAEEEGGARSKHRLDVGETERWRDEVEGMRAAGGMEVVVECRELIGALQAELSVLKRSGAGNGQSLGIGSAPMGRLHTEMTHGREEGQ